MLTGIAMLLTGRFSAEPVSSSGYNIKLAFLIWNTKLSINFASSILRQTGLRHTLWNTTYKEWKDNTHTQFKITKSFATTWMPQSQLSLAIQGQSLPRIYDNFVAQVSGIGEHKAGALADIVELKKRIAALEAELQALEKRMRREPQYDVQVKMNKQVKAKRRELTEPKEKLEKLK